jgi:transposase
MVKLFNVKRSLTAKEKLNAIYATFGSLSDFTHKRKVSFTKLSEELGMKRTTLSELIYRFKGKYSSNLDHFIVGHKRPGRPIQIIGSVETEKYLLSSSCLHDWVHLTLR